MPVMTETIENKEISSSGEYAGTHAYCMFQEKPLELETAIKILENVDKYRSVAYPPVKPKGGEVYLFLPQFIEEQDNWKCDHYRWLNNGPKEIPRRGPLVRKLYFLARVPEGKTFQFQRHAYVLIADTRSPKPVLVHYIGDESIMIDFPHGNSKKTVKPFIAIAPSVRKEIVRKSLASPSDIIESMKSKTDDANNPAMAPRNKNQIRNLKRRQRMLDAGNKLKKVSLNNILDMVENIPGFVHHLQTVPDIMCIVGLAELSNALEDLLKLSSLDPLVFSYCEPFKIGKLNIAIFMFEHVAFVGKPAFPCHAVIYDNESEVVHKTLLKFVSESIPSLNSYKGPIVTGRESTVTECIKSIFPKLSTVTDWEHIVVETRLWLRSIGATVSQINVFTDHLRLLLDSPTKEHYDEKLIRCSESWTEEFRQYYNEKIKENIETRLGRWILQRYSLFSKDLGVTDIMCNGLQVLMRDLQEIKDPALDTIAIALYHISVHLANEITKGYCNIGTYRIRQELLYLQRPSDEAFILENTFAPSTIVAALKANRLPFQPSGLGEKIDESMRAERIHSAGNVVHVSQLQAFLVKGICDDVHAVRLYPNQYCTCQSKDQCCHILAVKLSLGLAQSSVRSKINPAPCIVVNVAQPTPSPPQQPSTVNDTQVNAAAAAAAAAAQTIANLVASGAPAQPAAANQQVFTLESFIDALTVARECIVSPANATVNQHQTMTNLSG